jgi:hypothetical protein
MAAEPSYIRMQYEEIKKEKKEKNVEERQSTSERPIFKA